MPNITLIMRGAPHAPADSKILARISLGTLERFLGDLRSG
jgi:hypothetical protein